MTNANLKIMDEPARCDLLSASYTEKRFVPHFHRTYSFGVIIQGRCDFLCDGQLQSALAGDICVMHPYEIHTGGTDKGTLHYHMIYPSMYWIAMLCKKPINHLPVFASPVIRDPEAFAALAAVLFDIANHGTRNDSHFDALENIIRKIIITHAVSVGTFQSPSKYPGAIGSACHYLEKYWQNSISFSELADKVGLSQYYFCRQFKKTVGLQPRSYLRQIRLVRAKKMILTGCGLADASAAAGFADQAHMTREFQKVYGVTPSHISVCTQLS